ncbi:butyrophilin subfamily 2 member A2-like [Pholidichthys leucotaenia]
MALLKMAVLLSLLRVSFTSADSPNIKAEPGQTVVLPCRAPVNNTDIAVEYSRADLEPESVFLHRDKQNIHEGQHESFKNRVELLDKQMKNGDVSLVLNNVTFSDSGVYKCHVLYKEGEKTKELITTITLTVGECCCDAGSGVCNLWLPVSFTEDKMKSQKSTPKKIKL